jgi:hypothetical protein
VVHAPPAGAGRQKLAPIAVICVGCSSADARACPSAIDAALPLDAADYAAAAVKEPKQQPESLGSVEMLFNACGGLTRCCSNYPLALAQ